MNAEEKAGIRREVVEHDCYRLKELKFVPDVIFDIGANIGIFTRYAHDRFPEASIIAVEPDNENHNTFTMKDVPGIIVIKKAIGKGKIYRHDNQWGGAQECYHSQMLGYKEEYLANSSLYKPTDVESVTLAELVKKYVKPGQKFIVKIDCEGAENSILDDRDSIDALMDSDYFSIELHYFSSENAIHEITNGILKLFELTHNCKKLGNMFYATKEIR